MTLGVRLWASVRCLETVVIVTDTINKARLNWWTRSVKNQVRRFHYCRNICEFSQTLSVNSCKKFCFLRPFPGLSPDLQSMEQIRRVMRPTDVPDQGLLCDLLWADPDKDVLGWGENDRGVSFTFGADVVTKFLHKHDMDLICRAHQVSAQPLSWAEQICCGCWTQASKCSQQHWISLVIFRWSQLALGSVWPVYGCLARAKL